MGNISFDAVVDAVKSVGFPIVAFILLVLVIVVPILLLLRYVIFDAVRYFTTRLDSMSNSQAAAFTRVAEALDRQTEQISLNREQAAKNNEAIQIMIQFMSHTQQELVAHRTSVEPSITGEASDTGIVPSPPFTTNPGG